MKKLLLLDADVVIDLYFFYFDRIYRINGIFSACGGRDTLGRSPFYPVDPVNPV
jgi:hypothetical protein